MGGVESYHLLIGLLQQPFPSRTIKAPARAAQQQTTVGAAPASSAVTTTSDTELLSWVNSHLPATTTPATDLSSSLRSGEVVVRLVEKLSGKDSGIKDSDFAKYAPPKQPGQFDSAYFETIFNGEFRGPEGHSELAALLQSAHVCLSQTSLPSRHSL